MTASSPAATPASATDGHLTVDEGRVRLLGTWQIAEAGRLRRALEEVPGAPGGRLEVDLGELERFDTACSLVLYRWVERRREAGETVALVGLRAGHESLLEEVAEHAGPGRGGGPRPRPSLASRSLRAVLSPIGQLGAATSAVGRETVDLVAFLGEVTLVLVGSLLRPWRLRWTSLVSHMERAGLAALPIVALISFLIGIVLAYQGASQLRRFGAQVFVVDLVAIGVLREVAILLTAIVVAGRSGSAFTAQIGSMKLNEEVDALRTLGLDPLEVLVVPRLLALVLTLPLLAVCADAAALLGGALMAWQSLGITPVQFLARLQGAVEPATFWVGIIKAPVFAGLIALAACFEGFKVEGSAESLGLRTTRSVVEAIFLVIVADALFSILFDVLGI